MKDKAVRIEVIDAIYKADNYRINVVKSILNNLYKKKLRNFLLLILIAVILTYTSLISLKYYLNLVVETSVCSTAAFDVLSAKADGEDISFIEETYLLEDIRPFTRVIMKAVKDGDADKIRMIAGEIRDTERILSYISAISVVAMLVVYVLIYAIIKQVLRLLYYKEKEVKVIEENKRIGEIKDEDIL